MMKSRGIGGTYSIHGKMRNAYKIAVEKPEGKTSIGRYKYGWKYNIKMDFKETGCEGVDWIQLV